MTESGLKPGETCWRIERASCASVIVDGDDYFRHARQAMLGAEKRIVLIGWDFDGDLDLDRSAEAVEGPREIADFFCWLTDRNPELEIFILRWDIGLLKMVLRGNALGALVKWSRNKRIHARLDGHHPPAGSHHQKIVVIDDRLAFCGGIDMLSDRWDTRAHRDGDGGRRDRKGKISKPWHDATTALAGPAARALGDLFRERWKAAGGGPVGEAEVQSEPWPEGLAVQFRDVDVAIARSSPLMDDSPPVREIEALYLEQIARAKRFIYAESQYFASRRIAEAMARRLDEPDGPEIVLINPVTAEGWLEPIAMDSARARLVEALRRRDVHGRFRVYHPHTAGGEPIYVHAKITVVDDLSLRVGSSNMNNRSMRLDTECDVVIDARLAANAGAEDVIRATRESLMAEHLGVDAETVRGTVEETGSLIAAIERLRGQGKTLKPYETPDLSSVEAWLAENEALDPEGPEEMFEPFSRRGLFRRLRKPKG
ncbi:phospholipase D-like domain-containing protein [Brevundimonas sp. PAMC22021]|uniref:phospholipase D-like domain-containing protein n=1 Tax=Brevundimonas sp. PAMC22021 TaxID=2861285 RepID=UPI001C62D1EA|nr:phospholipase D-like domain-containing protein [Brevundimonas sp. PAMC22021]QYF87551.1 phospholipase [Brevundimonas sp. PAMC22021]